MEKSSESRKRAYRNWYARNKESFNERRRDRYARDDDHRKVSRRHYSKYLEGVRLGKLHSQRYFREIDGVEAEVYTMGQISEWCQRSRNTLNGWRAKGWIPPCTVEGDRAYYTWTQLLWIEELSLLLSLIGGPSRHPKEFNDLIVRMREGWD